MLKKMKLLIVLVVVIIMCCNVLTVKAGDIVHDDDVAPKKPGCENDFILVKVQTWSGDVEDSEFVGVGARFGKTIVKKEKNAHHTPLRLAEPRDCCTPLKDKLVGDVIMVDRGNCKFTTKANIAEAAGASAILIINTERELYKMVCEPDETDLDIHIPAVMLPQEAGTNLEMKLTNSSHGGKVFIFLILPLNLYWKGSLKLEIEKRKRGFGVETNKNRTGGNLYENG